MIQPRRDLSLQEQQIQNIDAVNNSTYGNKSG